MPSLYIRDGFNTLISFYGKSNSEKRPIAEAGRGGLWSCWPASAIEDIYLVVPYQPQNVRLGCTRPKCSVQKVSNKQKPKISQTAYGTVLQNDQFAALKDRSWRFLLFRRFLSPKPAN